MHRYKKQTASHLDKTSNLLSKLGWRTIYSHFQLFQDRRSSTVSAASKCKNRRDFISFRFLLQIRSLCLKISTSRRLADAGDSPHTGCFDFFSSSTELIRTKLGEC